MLQKKRFNVIFFYLLIASQWVIANPTQSDLILARLGEVSPGMLSAAVNFRTKLQLPKGYRSGIYIYNGKSISSYINNPEKLAARIALLGFQDVYLSASKTAMQGTDKKRWQWIKTFNKTAHRYGLRVWALRLFDNNAYVSNQVVIDECTRIKNYNKNVSDDERFDGVSADWEPHTLKQAKAGNPQGLTWFWDSSGYFEKDGSKDMLLKGTIQILELAKKNLEGLPLNQAIHYMYQKNYDAGNLNYGATLHFLKPCRYVMLMNYTNSKERLWKNSVSVLNNASFKEKSVSIVIKTSLNTYADGGNTSTSIHPEGWDYLLETLEYLYSPIRAGGKPAFRGVDFFEFDGFEKMWSIN